MMSDRLPNHADRSSRFGTSTWSTLSVFGQRIRRDKGVVGWWQNAPWQGF